MQILTSPTPLTARPAATKAAAAPAPTAGETAVPIDGVKFDSFEIDKDALKIEHGKLVKHAKQGALAGGIVGTLAGAAAGLAGGVLGAVAGMSLAGAGAVVGAAALAYGGWKLATHNRQGGLALLGGILAGAAGAVAGGVGGFYGGLAVGAMAGAAGGVAGALAGAAGVGTIGAAIGAASKTITEVLNNKAEYPNTIAQVRQDMAEAHAKENAGKISSKGH